MTRALLVAAPVRWIERHPHLAVAAFTASCLLLFWATIPLPRIDGALVGSDGVGYYVYLPSVLIDHDLDFTDEYQYFYAYDAARAERVLALRTPLRLPQNFYPIGAALLWAPFFLMAHGIVLLANLGGAGLAADGYGLLYQASALTATILYGGAGLLLAMRVARRVASPGAAVLATLLVAAGGNLVYYMTAEPSMSHAMSAAATALFFCTWLSCRDRRDVRAAALLGATGGLMALVRYQDGLVLAVPFLLRLPEAWNSLRRRDTTGGLWLLLRDVGVAAGAALAAFAPQLVVWRLLYGAFFLIPQQYAWPGSLISWTSPHPLEVLFSPVRGLFVWHPVFLLAVLGLLVARSRDRRLAAAGLLAIAVQWAMVSVWFGWMQGQSFGGRMFIGCTVAFVIGLASLIDWTRQHWSTAGVVAVGVVLVVWNALLFVEYRLDLATSNRWPGWYEVTGRRLLFPWERWVKPRDRGSSGIAPSLASPRKELLTPVTLTPTVDLWMLETPPRQVPPEAISRAYGRGRRTVGGVPVCRPRRVRAQVGQRRGQPSRAARVHSSDDTLGLLRYDWGGERVALGSESISVVADARVLAHRALYEEDLLRIRTDTRWCAAAGFTGDTTIARSEAGGLPSHCERTRTPVISGAAARAAALDAV